MKLQTIILMLAFGGGLLLSNKSFAQSTGSNTSDSLAIRKIEKENDSNRIASAKEARRETKAKAKEAKRIQRDADDAAKQSKEALKAEERAQQSRKDADAQSKKALDARAKSNEN